MVFCPDCGAENADSAKFCKNCGHALNANRPIKDNYVNTGIDPSARVNDNSNSSNSNINSNSKSDNKNLIIICLTIVICALLIAGAMVMFSNSNADNDSEFFDPEIVSFMFNRLRNVLLGYYLLLYHKYAYFSIKKGNFIKSSHKITVQ